MVQVCKMLHMSKVCRGVASLFDLGRIQLAHPCSEQNLIVVISTTVLGFIQ